MRFKSLYILTIVAAEVALVCSHYLLSLGKLGGVFLKLRIYGVEIRNGIAPLGAGNINKMYQQTAAVDMAQKIVEAPSIMPGISAITNERPSST